MSTYSTSRGSVFTKPLFKMVSLTDAVFTNGDSLGSQELSKYVIKEVEEIRGDLTRFQEWDGSSPVATFALGLQDGAINQCVLHLEGRTDPKRLEVAAVMGRNYTGGPSHQVRFGKVDLAKLIFAGSLVSDWLGPGEVDWSVQRPSVSRPGTWRDVPKENVLEDGALPLHFRAVAQPWTGGKVKVVLGFFPSLDVSALPDYEHPRFPFIMFNTVICDFMPGQPDGFQIPLPFTPYLLNQGEEDEVDIPEFMVIRSACVGFFRNTTAPHIKSTPGTLADVLKTDWRKAKPSKYIFPEIV